MKATELLKAQHKTVDKLFESIENAKDETKKAELFQELAADLVGHDGIEREIFYPACEATMGMTDLLGEALVEHGVVEFCLYEANNALGSKTFEFKMTVLREVVEHHVEEEETEFFPKVEKAFEKEELEALAVQMKAKFEASKKEDFRGPLFTNLQQVLAGAIKPKKGGQPAPKNGSSKSKSQSTSSR